MKIKNKEYRIKEKVYKDGHKVYTAQVATNFYFFKIWNDFISSVSDYGYGCIRWICCGHTYEECFISSLLLYLFLLYLNKI